MRKLRTWTTICSRCFELLCTLFALISLSSCTRYSPKPLDPGAIFEESKLVALNDLTEKQSKASLETSPRIDPSDGLDADEVAFAALFLNPALKAKRAEKGIAAGQLIDAKLWPNPEFSSNLRWEKDGRGRSFEPELSFEVLRWGERKGTRQAANANVEAVRFEILADEWKVVSDARVAYWDVAALREKLRVSKESLDIAEKLSKSVRSRVTRGVATAMDLNLAEIEHVRSQLENKRVEGELAAAERNLRLVIGLPPAAELKLQIPEKPLSRIQHTWTYGDAENQLTGTASLKAEEWRYQVSEGNLRAAIARQFPGLRLGPSNSIEFDGHWTSFLGFLVSLNLPILNRNQGEVIEKLAAREKARADYLARLHELRSSLADAFGQLEISEGLLDFQEKELLPKAQETLRLTERAIEAGELDIFELFKAQTSIVEIKQGYLAALVQYRTALQSVERVLGKPLNSLEINSNDRAPQTPAPHAEPAPKPTQGE